MCVCVCVCVCVCRHRPWGSAAVNRRVPAALLEVQCAVLFQEWSLEFPHHKEKGKALFGAMRSISSSEEDLLRGEYCTSASSQGEGVKGIYPKNIEVPEIPLSDEISSESGSDWSRGLYAFRFESVLA